MTIEITDELLDKLESAAKEATQGGWVEYLSFVHNPQTTLALIAHVRKLEEKLKAAEEKYVDNSTLVRKQVRIEELEEKVKVAEEYFEQINSVGRSSPDLAGMGSILFMSDEALAKLRS